VRGAGEDACSAWLTSWAAVLECIVERLDAKIPLLQRLETLEPLRQAVFASNTSSIPMSDMSKHVRVSLRELHAFHSHAWLKMSDPSNLVGIHFFHPDKNVTPIIEIIEPTRMHARAGAMAVAFSNQLGKVPFLVSYPEHARELAGHVVNRMACSFYAMAGHLAIRHGIPITDVDECATRIGFAVRVLDWHECTHSRGSPAWSFPCARFDRDPNCVECVPSDFPRGTCE
jgi:3-hydroxyacyl-CoA dehydrogenase